MEEWKSLWRMILRMAVGVKKIITGSISIRKMKKELKRRSINWKG